MSSSKERTLCLETLCAGAAVERFNDELKVVLANVIDANTGHKPKRSITLKVEFSPNEERSNMSIGITCSSKLAPPKAVDGFAYIGSGKEGVVATEYNPRQPELPMIGKERAG